MREKITYNWDAEKGIANCHITNKHGAFDGFAKCNPTDIDMKSEKTGLSIAEKRARIKVVQEEKKRVLISLSSYNNLYTSMKDSKYFNKESYEAKRLERFIAFAQDDLETANATLEVLNNDLKVYINSKEIFYTILRGMRSAKACAKTDKKEELK